MRYDSTDWRLEIPDGWSPTEDESCTTFCHPQGVGAFHEWRQTVDWSERIGLNKAVWGGLGMVFCG